MLDDPDFSIQEFAAHRSDDKRQLIRFMPGQIAQLATQAEAVLLQSDLPLFKCGSALVRLTVTELPTPRGGIRTVAMLTEVTIPALIDLFSRVLRLERFDKRSRAWRPIDPPKELATLYLSRAGEWKLPTVAGVVTTPTLRFDGSLLTAPGYDVITRLYHVPDPALRLPVLQDEPSRADAEDALSRLCRLLAGFPFVSDVDRSVALSALITPVVRGALSVAPMHVIRANTAGTGKSFLVDLASAIATGRVCPVIAAAASADETEKRLVGLLLTGYPIVSLDNVNGELGGDFLCQAVERQLVRVRPLGRSGITEIESRACIFATGNALRVRGDMVRRSMVCNLDAGMERPELRCFEFDPVAKVLANRGCYVAAALTIARAHIAAGRPNTLPRLASFEDWSDLVRSALVWLGQVDPCVSMQAAREDDPELINLREVLTLWHQRFGNEGRTVRQVINDLVGRISRGLSPTLDGDLHDALLRIAGDRGVINTRRLGKWLFAHEGRIVGSLRIARVGQANGGVIRWAISQRATA